MGTIWEAINKLQLEMKEAQLEIKALKGGEPAKKKRPKKARVTTWDPDHDWDQAFRHMNRIAAYRLIFDVTIDGPKLTYYALQSGHNHGELTRTIGDFADYWQHNPKPMKNPRGSLATWMANRRDWQTRDQKGKQFDYSGSDNQTF